jgi:outer membrane immunogenic protein
MMKPWIAAALATLLAAPQAFAQAQNFEGFSVVGIINANSNSEEWANKADTTQSNMGAMAQYDLALGSTWVLGVGTQFGLNDFDIATNAKLKNTYGLFIAPGFALNDTTMLYLKVGSASAKVEINGISADLTGLGYGLGAKYLGNKNVFYQAEYLLNKYDDKTVGGLTFKNKTSVLTVGVGYKF